MSNTNFANASNEKREQNMMRLQRMFNEHKVITVKQAARAFLKTDNTIIKWARDKNIPLMIDNTHSVVPWTDNNQPNDLPKGSTPGDGFMAYLAQQ